MTSTIRFSAIHLIVGPGTQVVTKRDSLVSKAKEASLPFVTCTEASSLVNLASDFSTVAAVVLTGKDADTTMKTKDVRAYLNAHPKTDADGKPIQYHHLFSRLFNPIRRLWYTVMPWISLDQSKKGRYIGRDHS
jgi:hypothetical protein